MGVQIRAMSVTVTRMGAISFREGVPYSALLSPFQPRLQISCCENDSIFCHSTRERARRHTSYLGADDELSDGVYSNGDLLGAAFNNDDLSGEVSAEAGTTRANVSHFLVDSNAGGDPREQLAQQLLAFIFNVRHRLSSEDAYIWYDGQSVQASALIADAIAAWQSGTAEEQNEIAQLLDLLNNNNEYGDPPGIFSVAPTVAEAVALCGAPPAP